MAWGWSQGFCMFVCLVLFIYFCFTYEYPNCQTICWKRSFFSIALHLCQKLTGHTCCVSVFLCVHPVTITHLEFCTFIVSLKIREYDSSTCILFFSPKLFILVPLPLHINWNHLVYIYKKCCLHFLLLVVNL